MDCHSKGLYVVAPIGSPREVREVELNLIPALIQSHGHSADEWLDPGGGLVVAGPESPPDILIVQDLHLESKILFELRYQLILTFLMIMTRKGSLIPSVSELF